MMVADKNAKTSLFPRRSRPVAGHPTGRTRQRGNHERASDTEHRNKSGIHWRHTDGALHRQE